MCKNNTILSKPDYMTLICVSFKNLRATYRHSQVLIPLQKAIMNPNQLAVDVQKIMFDQDWFSQWLGIECLEMRPGYCKLQMKVKKEMLNGFQIVHGGVTFSLADSALAFAANSYGRVSVSIEASMSYLQSAKEGDTLIAEAQQISMSDKIGVYHIIVVNQNGMTISDFKGTVYRTAKEHVTPNAGA